jgi:hypothetical protein
MRARMLLITSAAAAVVLVALAGELATSTNAQGQQPLREVDMGDYEPVVPWPLPLPDTDHSHDGWTWGSGARVAKFDPNGKFIKGWGSRQRIPGTRRHTSSGRCTASASAATGGSS